MRITEVEVQDVMKITYVQVSPEGSLTIVGGKNRAGKSSLLGSIAMALGGKKLCPEKPIRQGAKQATVRVKIDGDDELMIPPSTVVRRFWLRDDGSIKSELEIVSEDGYAAPEPQTLLNRILTNATFDPLYFTRLKPREQADTLRELVGIDTAELDAKHEQLYATRTVVGREVKKLKGHVDSLPPYDDEAPDELQSASEVMERLQAAQEHNAANEEQKRHLDILEQRLGQMEDQGREIEEHITDLEQKLRALHARLDQNKRGREEQEAKIGAQRDRVEQLEYKDVESLREEAAGVDAVNQRVRQNQRRQEVAAAYSDKQSEYESLTEEIQQNRKEKQRLHESAQWPIEGLGFAESGVTFNELPFAQCSSAEQLRISVAMGFALNPKLKLLIIRDGSLLDEDSLTDVAKLAAEHGGQVFLERVGEGSECHVVLRDGAVVEEDQPA